MRELPPEVRDSALTVLRDATLWRLSPARWELLAELLDAAAAACAAGDGAALDAASAGLEAAGAERVTRIGTPPGEPAREPAPPAVRERLNQLIHALSGPGADARAREESPSGAPRPGDRP